MSIGRRTHFFFKIPDLLNLIYIISANLIKVPAGFFWWKLTDLFCNLFGNANDQELPRQSERRRIVGVLYYQISRRILKL